MKIFVVCTDCREGVEFDDLGVYKCSLCGNDKFNEVANPYEVVAEKDKCPCGSGRGAYWENDGRGIPLCKVCVDCREEKLSKYEPWVLRYYSEEDCGCAIEPEDYY